MKGKTALVVSIGAFAAGIVCLVVGLILFYTVKGNAIVVIGAFFAIYTGVVTAGIALIALIIVLIYMLTHKKNKQEDGEKNDG